MAEMVAGLEEIISQARKGDKAAFDELIRSFYRLAWSISYPILKDNALVEEAVQETFIKVFRDIRALKDDRSFPSWISAIARNVSIDIKRKEQSRRRWKTCLMESTNSATTDEAQTKKKLIVELLNEMPEKYRIPLSLKYIHGLNNTEIRGLLGVSDGEVRGLLYRGRAMLKSLIESEMEMRVKGRKEVEEKGGLE